MVALALAGACILAAALGKPARVSAGTDNVILSVTLTSDEDDANTGDSLCDTDLGTSGLQCTLRAAIEQANAYAGTDPDVIFFNIPGPGVHQIAPSDFLPGITGAITIDAYS